MISKKGLLSELKNHLLKNFGESIQDVILFCSHARGGVNGDSDYDVLIVLGGAYSGKDENQILGLCYDIDLKYDILLDVRLISTHETNSFRGKQPVFSHAIKSGIYA